MTRIERCGWAYVGPFFCAKFHLQRISLQNERQSDGKEIKTPRLDESRYSHVKRTRKKEDTRVKHRSGFEADGRRDPAEGRQYGSIAGFERLRVFLKGWSIRRRLRINFKPARHVRYAAHFQAMLIRRSLPVPSVKPKEIFSPFANNFLCAKKS